MKVFKHFFPLQAIIVSWMCLNVYLDGTHFGALTSIPSLDATTLV